MVAAFAEDLLVHDGFHGFFGRLGVLGDDDALAQGQTVGLDDHRVFVLLGDIFHGLFRLVKHLVVRCGDMVFLHQVFGKDLAAFDLRRLSGGAEGGNAHLPQLVRQSQGQRIVRNDRRKVHLVAFGEFQHALHIGGLDGDALGVLTDAAVARQSIDLLHLFVFPELFDDGVLPSAAADHQKVHSVALPFSINDGTAAGR